MKKSDKLRIETEKAHLVRSLLGIIEEEVQRLDDNFQVARNLACSTWTNSNGGKVPSQIHPEEMVRLRKNYEMLRANISRRKYFIIKAFKPEGWKKEYAGCVDYWDKELKKQNPRLDD